MGVCLSVGRKEEAACDFDLCIAADGGRLWSMLF